MMNMPRKKIHLGDEVEDKITGFTGIAVCEIKFLNGCIQYGVQPTGVDKDGAMKEKEFIDEQQLKVVKKDKKEKSKGTKPPGGEFREYPNF